MRQKTAKSAQEFDRRFDNGEDIHDLINISDAKIMRPGKIDYTANGIAIFSPVASFTTKSRPFLSRLSCTLAFNSSKP